MKAVRGPVHYIEARSLQKKFGYKTALRNVDVLLQEGDSLALFGPNGAGKSTLIQILATLLTPTSGTVWLAGYDARRDREKVHGLMGLVTHHTLLYPHLSAYENLEFYGTLYGVSKLHKRIGEVLEVVGMHDHMREFVQNFSRGMQQRLALARAVLHDPAILLFDEPFTGLDPQGNENLKKLIRHFQDLGKTMIIALHDLSLGLELCQRAAIMKSGRIVYTQDAATIPGKEFYRIYSRLVGNVSPQEVAG